MLLFSEDDKKKSVYYQLVKNESDFTGIIAYSIYKNEKINFIEKHKVEQNNHPSSEDLDNFHEDKCNSEEVIRYRKLAEIKIEKLANQLLKDKVEEIDSIIKIEKKEIDDGKKSLKKQKSELENKITEIKNREENIEKREFHCKVKPERGFKNFSYGVLQSLAATAIIVFLGFIFIVFTKYELDTSSIIKEKKQPIQIEQTIDNNDQNTINEDSN